MNRFKIQHLLMIVLPVLAAWLGSILAGVKPGPAGISLSSIAISAAFLSGVLALFERYLNDRLKWPVGIFLAVAFAALSLIAADAPISILALLLPNLLYVTISMFLIRFIFYSKSFFRLRTLLMGIFGGLLISAYLAAVYTAIGMELVEGFWSASFMYGLIIYVFASFGMSVADLIILQSEVRQLKKEDASEDDQ